MVTLAFVARVHKVFLLARNLAVFFTCLGREVRFAGLDGTVVAAADVGLYSHDGKALGAEGSNPPLSEPPL